MRVDTVTARTWMILPLGALAVIRTGKGAVQVVIGKPVRFVADELRGLCRSAPGETGGREGDKISAAPNREFYLLFYKEKTT